MPHVLIIEDSYLFGQFVCDAAILAGARTVEVAETEADAERAATRCAPALIVADVRLRHGTGVAAVRRITGTGGHIPVLYVTGHPQGCSGCPSGSAVIEKPVSHDRLRDSIRQLIGTRSVRPVTH
jgi:DNA-binding NtrC family response regulator